MKIIQFSAAREARQNQLKNQERDLMIEQEELHQARQLQLRKEKKEKQENYQKILYRQYRAQILRRAHEIERELEEDLAVLERVELETRRDENDSTEKRERARQYAQVFMLYFLDYGNARSSSILAFKFYMFYYSSFFY